MDPASPTGRALSYEQVRKLHRVLSDPIQIQPPSNFGYQNFPPLSISPADIVKVVRQRILAKNITLRDVRLNGSAASHCLCEDSDSLPFNDVDLIFRIEVEREYEFHVIKEEVLTSLLEFFPKDVSKISSITLEEAYVRKMVLIVKSENQWSLISLGDGVNKSIELKFVSVMKRPFEFSVDSFQIILDSFFNFDNFCTDESPVAMTQSFFPSVQAVSMYGDFSEALHHLNNRLVDTVTPEQIRGGGLLKYCSLLISGFKPADPEKMKKLEPYMCSRFFIDFPSAEAQFFKLHKYIMTRFLQQGEIPKCLEFLNTLEHVVNSRAMCLMIAQRHRTISVINHLRCSIFPYHVLPPPVPMASYPFPSPPPHGHLPPIPPMSPFGPVHFRFDPSRVSPPPFVSDFPRTQWPSGTSASAMSSYCV